MCVCVKGTFQNHSAAKADLINTVLSDTVLPTQSASTLARVLGTGHMTCCWVQQVLAGIAECQDHRETVVRVLN